VSNWLTDFDATKTAYSTYPECNCEVHKGFYDAEQLVIGNILTQVAQLKALHPTARVKTTGHSLGAALATLTAMDLAKVYPDVQCYNYGSPRVGTKAFSAFAGTKMTDFWRVTHYKDIVPHVPNTTFPESYWHVCTEEYEDGFGNLSTCNSTCEDPKCADQWAAYQWNGDDHTWYLGVCMGTCGGQCVLA